MPFQSRVWTRQPQGRAKAARILGLRHLWNFADKSGVCLITGQQLTLGTSAGYEPDGTLFSPSSSNGGSPTTLPLSFHAAGPIGVVIASRRTLGTVSWSLMNPNWDGWYETDGTILSTNNTDFSGSVTPTAGNAPALPIRATAMTMGGANDLRASIVGGPVSLDSACAAPTPDSPNSTFRIGTDGGNTNGANVYVAFVAIFDRALSDDELIRYSARPYSTLFAPRRIWVPVSAATSHATSGDLASDPAAIAGTATHLTLHTTSGALASDAAAIAGTATHLTLHATSGALASDAATIAGEADHTEPGGVTHTTTGALSSDAAAIAGTAAHLTLHATTGALSADAATVAGTAAHLTLHTTSGALASDPATMAGTAVHSGAGAEVPRNTGAGKSKRRPRVVEIDGEDFVVNSEDEAVALLEKAREQAKELAATAVKRAAAAEKRPYNKVVKDARRLLETPDIKAPDDLQPLVSQAQADISAIYASALASVEIAALMAKRQREEEDDEDVLLLIA